MKQQISRSWMMVIFIFTLMFSSFACQIFSGGAPPNTQVATEVSATPTITPRATEVSATPEVSSDSTEISAEGEVSFGPGSYNFVNPAAGLSDLASYTAILRLSFNGTQAGQPNLWSKTYTLLSTHQPALRQLTIEKSGQVSDPNPEFMAQVLEVAYVQNGAQACSASVLEPGDSFAEQMEPAVFLSGVFGAEEAGNDTINGVATNHFSFDERALGQSGYAKSTGELWVAAEGGYLLKYALTTQGGADYFGEGTEGTVTWDYELTGINQPVEIVLPQDCPPGLVNVPRLPDSAGVVNQPGWLSFTTATSMAESVAFFQQQLPALGWQPVSEPILNETMALLDFTQSNEQLSIIITPGAEGTQVYLVLENQDR